MVLREKVQRLQFNVLQLPVNLGIGITNTGTGIEFVMVAPLVVVIEVVLVFGAKIDIAAVTVRLDGSLIIKFYIFLKGHKILQNLHHRYL